MAVSKRGTSKTRKNKRRTYFRISVSGMTKYPNCGEYKLSHCVCKNCGSCNGEEVVSKQFISTKKRWNTNSS